MEPTPSRPVKFGKYRLIKKIGMGGMAEVYKATYAQDTTKTIAIKKILADLSRDKKLVSMLVNEAKLAMMLSHPNVVPIYDFGLVDSHYFIAMEYIEGRDLRLFLKKAYLEGNVFPLEITLHIVISILEGLSYAHSRRDNFNKPLEIVHRDISPQNIIVSYGGDVKILDFGIAKAKGSLTETQAGILKGKFSYMSPEQAKGNDIDQRSDIFSTGIVLHELLTTRSLFGDQSEIKIIEKVRKAKAPNPSSINPDVPKSLSKIVMKSLAKWRFMRFRNAWDFKEELLSWSYKNGLTISKELMKDYIALEFPQGIEPEILDMNMAGEASEITYADRIKTKTDLEARSVQHNIADLIEEELDDLKSSGESKETVTDPPNFSPSLETDSSDPEFRPKRNLLRHLGAKVIILLALLGLAIFVFAKREKIDISSPFIQKIYRYAVLIPREKIHGMIGEKTVLRPVIAFNPEDVFRQNPKVFFSDSARDDLSGLSLRKFDRIADGMKKVLSAAGKESGKAKKCIPQLVQGSCVVIDGMKITFTRDIVAGNLTIVSID